MVEPTIREVYASILREIAASPELAREVFLQAFFIGPYQAGDDDSRTGFTYARGGHEIGSLFYSGTRELKGEENLLEERGFHFVPTPKLTELESRQLLRIAEELETGGRLTGRIKLVSGEQVVRDIRTDDDKASDDRLAKSRRGAGVEYLYNQRPKKRKPRAG